MRAGRGRPFNRVRTGPGVGELADHTHVTRNSQKRYRILCNCIITHVTAPWPARSPATMTLLAGPSGTVTLTLVSSTLSLRSGDLQTMMPVPRPRHALARTWRPHIPPRTPSPGALFSGPDTQARAAAGAPNRRRPNRRRPNRRRPNRRETAATAALSRCVPCSWYPKWYPSTWRQTAPRSQTPCTHRPHSRPERRRSSLST